jgi:hypothetical protein
LSVEENDMPKRSIALMALLGLALSGLPACTSSGDPGQRAGGAAPGATAASPSPSGYGYRPEASVGKGDGGGGGY